MLLCYFSIVLVFVFQPSCATSADVFVWDKPLQERLEKHQRDLDSALKRLASGNAEEQFAAQADCAATKDPECTEALLKFLSQSSLPHKRNALAALSEIRDHRALLSILKEIKPGNNPDYDKLLFRILQAITNKAYIPSTRKAWEKELNSMPNVSRSLGWNVSLWIPPTQYVEPATKSALLLKYADELAKFPVACYLAAEKFLPEDHWIAAEFFYGKTVSALKADYIRSKKKFLDARFDQDHLTRSLKDPSKGRLFWAALDGYGGALSKLQKYPAALSTFELAIEVANQIPDRVVSARANYNLACALALNKKFGAALDHLRLAMTQSRKYARTALTDPDLDELRKQPEFSAFIEQVEKGRTERPEQ